MKRLILVSAMALMLLPAAGAAEEVVFGAQPLPPFVIEENGVLSGSDVDIVREVCKQIGVEPKIRILPFVRLLEAVKKGDIDANFPIYHTKERESFLYYSPEPHNVRRMVVLARKESRAKIAGLKDLEGRTIAVVSGYAYGKAFDNHAGLKKEACKTDKELLTMLVKGRRDFAATEESVALYTAGKLGFSDQIEVVYVLSEDPLYVTFSKAADIPGKILAERFGKALARLKEEGVVQKIIERYR